MLITARTNPFAFIFLAKSNLVPIGIQNLVSHFITAHSVAISEMCILSLHDDDAVFWERCFFFGVGDNLAEISTYFACLECFARSFVCSSCV